MKLTHIRAALVSAALMTASAVASGGTGQAKDGVNPHGQTATRATAPELVDCMDHYGVNLNEYLSIEEQIIGHPGCRRVPSGEKWALSVPGWRMVADGKKAVYPQGYRAARTRGVPPMLDFQAKFRGARVVLDNGAEKRTLTFGPELLQDTIRGDELVHTALVSRPLPPLPVGKYRVTAFLRMSHEHYDGVGRDPQANRLSPGESRLPDSFFEVKEMGDVKR
ncbi:hypothetical protein ACIBKX_33025 [Streptomyces sp. NPDC050658]|uniref:hypothetical protein n=1 Tax=unclassified Streptomyces TaxID=2593676 RepID=UPI0034221F14